MSGTFERHVTRCDWPMYRAIGRLSAGESHRVAAPLDDSIVYRISSTFCFRISSFAFFFMVLHISTYSMWSLGVSFSIISLRFFIRALVGDDIFEFFCFLVCFAMLKALCWIISVMFLFRLFMSSCSSSAVNLFFLVRFETCSSSFRSFECQLCSCILVQKLPPFRSDV